MKQSFRVMVPALMIAACNKGPQVDLHNASANEVSKEVQQSGVMSSDTLVQPGLWESKVSVLDMTMPGIPPAPAIAGAP